MSKSTIRFRFVINQGGAKGVRSDSAGPINAALEGFVFKYARGTFYQIRAMMQHRVEQDIGTEISWMAGLFTKSVIGISRNRPNGTVNMAHEMAEGSKAAGIRSSAFAGSGIQWPQRGKKYMDWKKEQFGHSRWFLNNNEVLPKFMGKKGTWSQAFGPIVVTVSPSASGGGAGRFAEALTTRQRVKTGQVYRYRSAADSSIKAYVANIRVAALTNITPAMLPALASGTLGTYGGREAGDAMLRMLPPEVGMRLGGKGSYRHTIEPFLSFFLTQAVPNALFLRFEKSLGAKLNAQKRKY